jgi:preprotein translocase subunit YajC
VNSLVFLASALLAAAGGAAGGGAGGAGGQAGGGAPAPDLFNSIPWPLIIIALLAFYFLMIKPQRKEQARRGALLASLKKNDRVLTAGGVYGVITNVHREANEVTVKVDEATNTKLRMTLSSIIEVLGDEVSEDEKPK